LITLTLVVSILDAMQSPQEPPRPHPKHFDVQLLNPHPDCLAEITVEFPYLQERYEFSPLDLSDGDRLGRPKVHLALMREAELKYTESTGEKLAHWQRRLIARYTRNLAHMSGDLTANVYDVTVGARSIVDDNYGWG